MRKSRFSEEQIVGIVKEQGAGESTTTLCRRPGSKGDGTGIDATQEKSGQS